jgi:prepilin-type N-terminal cleavage/methylation domain-containing protein
MFERAQAVARGRRGFSLVELVLVLLVVAVAGAALYSYMGATKKSLETINTERPLNHARLAADLATLSVIRSQLDLYRSTRGEWPPSREAAVALLNPPPRFQCVGNDFTYDPASGTVGLVIMDAGRC